MKKHPTELDMRISQRKADMWRKYPGHKISKARVYWRDWKNDFEREVKVVFSNGIVVGSFCAIADYRDEKLSSSTGMSYISIN